MGRKPVKQEKSFIENELSAMGLGDPKKSKMKGPSK